MENNKSKSKSNPRRALFNGPFPENGYILSLQFKLSFQTENSHFLHSLHKINSFLFSTATTTENHSQHEAIHRSLALFRSVKTHIPMKLKTTQIPNVGNWNLFLNRDAFNSVYMPLSNRLLCFLLRFSLFLIFELCSCFHTFFPAEIHVAFLWIRFMQQSFILFPPFRIWVLIRLLWVRLLFCLVVSI